MYIQNATYKTIPTEGLTFPLEEGTVLTVNNITGIVPENVAVAAPTGVLYLAVGGTIDLTSEANAGITFTDAELNALSGDFNFIPLAEAGGSSLPAFTPADKGKILTIGDASPVETVIVPEQTWEQAEGTTLHDLAGADWTGIEVGDNVVVTLNGNTFNATVQGNSSRYQILYGDSNQIVYVFSSGATKSSIVTGTTQTYTLSMSKSVTPSVTTVIVPEQTLTFVNVGDDETPMYQATIAEPDFSVLTDGQSVDAYVDGVKHVCTYDGSNNEIYGDVYIQQSINKWTVELDMEGDWSGNHTISVSASVPTVSPIWESVGGYVAPASSATVINTIQSLVSDIMTSIVTGNKTNIVYKRAILTHADLASDYAILRETAKKYCGGVHTIFPVDTDAYSTVVNGFFESGGTGANLQLVVPNYVLQVPGVGNKAVFLVISIASLGGSYQIDVSAQIKEEIT